MPLGCLGAALAVRTGMKRRRHARSRRAIASQGLDVALAAPQVVAHRLGRFARATHPMSARDQREALTMGLEKVVAFQQSWLAMSIEVARLQQQAALSFWQAWWFPWTAGGRFGASRTDWPRATLGILGAGLAPIRSRALANARRARRALRR